MQRVFKTKTSIKFRQADPAQIMFFGNLFALAHDAFEELILDVGYSWEEWFKSNSYMIPIRHSEADFLAPLIPGKTYEIEAKVESFGHSSFVMIYSFKSDDRLHAQVKMVHAVLDIKTKEKIPLPEDLKQKLGKYGPLN